MDIHGDGQLTQWLREYKAGEFSLDELVDRLRGFEFKRIGWHQDSYYEKDIIAPGMEVDTWEELEWRAAHEPNGDARMSDDEYYELLRKFGGEAG